MVTYLLNQESKNEVLRVVQFNYNKDGFTLEFLTEKFGVVETDIEKLGIVQGTECTIALNDREGQGSGLLGVRSADTGGHVTGLIEAVISNKDLAELSDNYAHAVGWRW